MPIRPGTGRPVVGAVIALIAALLMTPSVVAAERSVVPEQAAEKVHGIVGNLKTRLEISVRVIVSIVPNNRLMMSIEPPPKHRGPFQLKVDPTFLAKLTDEELEAAIAHELGHVWVFTNHPYLQTEELANQIAMRVVSRAALERVYRKVWTYGGTRGDLLGVLGPEPGSAVGLAAKSPEP